MRCSVVIPCHNSVELTRACIASLLQQDLRPTEILIVDNGSSDDTPKLFEQDAIVRVIRLPQNLGFAGGVNAGLREAIGETILIVNNDTLAASNLLSELHRVLNSDANIGACAPVSNHVKGDAYLPVGDFGRSSVQRHELANELQATAIPVQDVDNLAGLCLLLRATTQREIGWFDERFGHGNYEDDDYCLRLRLHGYRLVIARRAFLHHEGHATFRSLGLDLKEQIAQRLTQFGTKWQRHPAGLATLAAIHGNFQLAALAAEQARRTAPLWPDADWHIGRYHECHGDAALAVQHLRTYLRHSNEHVEARLTLATALLRDGHGRASRRLLEGTLRRHRVTQSQERRLLLRLGQLAYEAKQFAAAATHFRNALEVDANNGELLNWLGLCQLADHHLPLATETFQAACDADYALAHTNLGICHTRLGQLDAAVACFARAVELLPNDAVVRANYDAGIAAHRRAASESHQLFDDARQGRLRHPAVCGQ